MGVPPVTTRAGRRSANARGSRTFLPTPLDGTASSRSLLSGKALIQSQLPRQDVGQTPICPCASMLTPRPMRPTSGPVFVQTTYRMTLYKYPTVRNHKRNSAMNASLLRGRLQVRILPGSPKTPEKYGLFTGLCAEACKKSRQPSGRNRLKRPISRTKPVQNSHVCAYFWGQS